MMFDMRAKPPRSLSRLLNAEPLTQTTVAVWVGLCCVLLATVAYWTVLVDSHRTQRSFTESQSWLRVGQMSHAVSVQVQTLLSGLDYTMRGLESDFADGDVDGFRRAVQTTFDAYPAGTFLQIAVADEKGDIVCTPTSSRKRRRGLPRSPSGTASISRCMPTARTWACSSAAPYRGVSPTNGPYS